MHWQSDSLTTRRDLICSRLDLIRTRLDLIRTRLDLISSSTCPKSKFMLKGTKVNYKCFMPYIYNNNYLNSFKHFLPIIQDGSHVILRLIAVLKYLRQTGNKICTANVRGLNWFGIRNRILSQRARTRTYTVKKAFQYFSPQPGCHLPISISPCWAGIETSYISYSRLGRVW